MTTRLAIFFFVISINNGASLRVEFRCSNAYPFLQRRYFFLSEGVEEYK